MFRHIKRILAFLSIILIYFIAKEFLELYVYLHAVHPYVAYGFIVLAAGVLIYFVGIPVYRILKIPKAPTPLMNEEHLEKELPRRFERLKANPHLKSIGFDLAPVPRTKEGYEKVMTILRKESARIRNKYVNRLFYSSAISQNGFIDAILILSSSVNLVKETFILYNGRVSNRIQYHGNTAKESVQRDEKSCRFKDQERGKLGDESGQSFL